MTYKQVKEFLIKRHKEIYDRETNSINNGLVDGMILKGTCIYREHNSNIVTCPCVLHTAFVAVCASE